ncbi:MAG: response regulator [Betaproteobacteria bacterium]
MATPPVEKNFCTTREAAQMLGVAVSTTQLWVESGILQAWRTSGGHRRVLRESVEAMLRKGPALVQGASAPPAALPAAARRLRVMVVDDDAILLRLYRAKLSQWPMAPEVVALDNAVTALLGMGRSTPDLLITDLQMPGMDGFNMLRVLQQAPEVSNTTIVVASGLDAEEIERRGGIPAGIEVLPKPIPFDRLLQIATAMVQRAPGTLRQA